MIKYIITKDGIKYGKWTYDFMNIIVALEFLKDVDPDHCWDYISVNV